MGWMSQLLGKNSDYFLVLGAGRGGTSLLAAMMDYHSELEVGMERFAFAYLLGRDLKGSKAYSLQARISHFYKACLKEAAASDKQWGNKITTEQLSALEECEEAYWPKYIQLFREKIIDRRKVVFIIRDGRACVQSKMKRTGQTYETAVSRWKRSVLILEYLKDSGVEIHTLKLEDLQLKPQAELESVCSFLGLEYQESMLDGPSNPNMPDIYKGNELRTSESGLEWPEQWTLDMYEPLVKLGYLNET